MTFIVHPIERGPRYDYEDIILWPDGTWCYRYELHEYSWKSDDYQTIPANTIAWQDWCNSVSSMSRL